MGDDLNKAFFAGEAADVSGGIFQFLAMLGSKQGIGHKDAVGEALEERDIGAGITENHDVLSGEHLVRQQLEQFYQRIALIDARLHQMLNIAGIEKLDITDMATEFGRFDAV